MAVYDRQLTDTTRKILIAVSGFWLRNFNWNNWILDLFICVAGLVAESDSELLIGIQIRSTVWARTARVRWFER